MGSASCRPAAERGAGVALRIGLIGAGLAGRALAARLAGVPGMVVEAFEATPPAPPDHGLLLAPNALRALRLHLPGAHAALRGASAPWTRWGAWTTEGRVLADLPLGALAEESGARLTMGGLEAALPHPPGPRDPLRLQHLEEDAARRLIPVLAAPDGARFRPRAFDLLVAGRGGALRRLIICHDEREPAPVMGARLALTESRGFPFDDPGEWWAPGARLQAWRLPGGAAVLEAMLALEADEPPPERLAPGFLRARFTPRPPTAAVAWAAERLAAAAPGLAWTQPADRPLRRTAMGGRVLFLGPAAHGIAPGLGQAESLAIEDGLVAATVLARGGSAEDVAAWRDTRASFARALCGELLGPLLPGGDLVAGGLARREPALQARLRRLFTDVPGPADFGG